MDFLDLKDIAERYLEILNPVSPEKILTIGRMAGMRAGETLIDFGCGFAEPLILWAENYGIAGTGIDIRQNAIERARAKIAQRGLVERLQVVQGKGADYRFEPNSCDYAACVGATFIWGGYKPALQALKQAVRPGGKLIVGEAYWQKDSVPPELAQSQTGVYSESWLLQTTWQEGLELEYVVRASHDDWDTYEAGNWYGLLRWIEENPAHPERQEVIDFLHESQAEYFRYGREYFGWAIYLLSPRRQP
jgi:SAM-dependent methyltransferase